MRYMYAICILFLVSCKPQFTAQEIVDKSIENSNLSALKNATISFNFRKKFYQANRNNGLFEFIKEEKKDSLTIKDILSNDSFKRYVNDSLVELSEKKQKGYGNSVNSVHYFSILPLGLNDKAVFKKILEETTIKGKDYYKIEVTFSEEGGGTDFDDVFIYWFSKDNFQLDYLAYKYHTNGGGIRFRDVKKETLVDGIRIVDYNNYKPLNKDIDFYNIDKLYDEGKLKKVSEIILENVQIKLNK
ncbi:deoxyribose-phosphate aldolase [Tenacibaculum aiptasiae]|uniref:Deoxyribose-phosphate aldolase n=2 Tax=Tenacibaculum aiptasiae TaxID=426481 RepID=A0A7J5APJ8_9FLAO|nr:deoxyribose-phosphate aldolase [Tenacibaculum aiptasiae]